MTTSDTSVEIMNADGSGQRRLDPTVEPSRKLTRTVDDVRFTLYVPKTGWETGPIEKIGNSVSPMALT